MKIALFLIMTFISFGFANANGFNSIQTYKRNIIYLDFFLGTQVSGIRKEDYILSNFAPYTQLSIGKWIKPSIAIAVNYQGPYYNFIGDNLKHNYLFIDFSGLLNLNSAFRPIKSEVWRNFVFIGPGYFYDFLERKSNVCLTGGFISEWRYRQNLSFKLKVSAIAGFKIYQHDKDILPNISLGISREFQVFSKNH